MSLARWSGVGNYGRTQSAVQALRPGTERFCPVYFSLFAARLALPKSVQTVSLQTTMSVFSQEELSPLERAVELAAELHEQTSRRSDGIYSRVFHLGHFCDSYPDLLVKNTDHNVIQDRASDAQAALRPR